MLYYSYIIILNENMYLFKQIPIWLYGILEQSIFYLLQDDCIYILYMTYYVFFEMYIDVFAKPTVF